MDYQRFITQLPELFDNWDSPTVQPKSLEFSQVLKQVNGMTTANILQLLNHAVDCLEPEEIYCEVGCFQGGSLIGALLHHPERSAYAIDDFSEFDPLGTNLSQLTENLLKFGLDEQVLFCCQDFETFFQELGNVTPQTPIGVYFYDAAADYRSLLMGLLLVQPFLADRALIVLANSNSAGVQQASGDFMATHPHCKLLLNLSTADFAAATFWNGLQILGWDKTQNAVDPQATSLARPQEAFLQAMKELGDRERQQLIHDLTLEAQRAIATYDPTQLQGYEAQPEILNWARKPLIKAEQKYREVLLWDAQNLDAWYGIGEIYSELGQYSKALETFSHLLHLAPSQPIFPAKMGLLLEKMGENSQAMQAFQTAMQLDANCTLACDRLGDLLCQMGKLTQAEQVYRQTIAHNPQHSAGYVGLGNVLKQQGQLEAAIAAYQTALSFNAVEPAALAGLGAIQELQHEPIAAALSLATAAFYQGNYPVAVKEYQRFIQLQADSTQIALDVYLNLANALRSLGQNWAAAEVCQQALEHYPQDERLHMLRIIVLEGSYPQAAIAAACEAAAQFPDNPSWQFEQWRVFPLLYSSVAEMDTYRERFQHGLTQLIQSPLETPESCQQALLGLWWRTNFFLQYQCRDDRDLQSRFGDYLHRVMAANYPEWAQPLSMPALSNGKKIRVGYISASLRNQNGGKWALGWIKPADREQFEIYCYHTGPQIDHITQQFRLYSDRFHHIPADLEAVCQQIRSDNLHVLVLTDIGTDPLTTQIAGLRLAPIQCTAWGHPITSGIPTVDYYLSGDLMEPEQAQEHYSETLIRLPNTGLCYPRPDIPPLPHTRQSFGLREDAVIYLSSQSLFKYQPQYDYLFAEIVQRVPNAQIAFLAYHYSEEVIQQFQERLQRSFAQFGLNREDYCVVVPRQNQLGFWGLNSVADVLLDSLGWSGGNTVFDAIACNLPVVTCPGEFMRGRHANGILKTMGMTETIAKSEQEYIAIAVKLGLDPDYRTQLRHQIQTQSYLIYNDKTCVEALEDFYREAVQAGLGK